MPYAFTQPDYLKFQEDILAANGDQATITTLLADMQQTFTESLAVVESTAASNTALTEENTRLKESNLGLLRRVGENALLSQSQLNNQPIEEDEPKYADIDAYLQDYFKK